MKYIKFKNLVIDWDEMGVSKGDYNENNNRFVKDGKIWSLTNLPNTQKNSFSELCLTNTKNLNEEELCKEYFDGIGYQSNPLWGLTGLCIESGELEIFDDLSEVEIKNSDFHSQ